MLPRLKELMPWEEFRATMAPIRESMPLDGDPAHDEIFWFKCLLLQYWNSLSDEILESEIADRVCFHVFLELDFQTEIPGSEMFAQFRELLKKHELFESLLDRSDEVLASNGLKLSRKARIIPCRLINKSEEPDSEA